MGKSISHLRGIRICAGQFIDRTVASWPCMGPAKRMEGSALGDLEEEMEAEAAEVNWGKVPADSCPDPR